jgi:hypothetical protein
MAAVPPPHHHEVMGSPLLSERFQSFSDEANRLVPRNLFPFPISSLALSFQRMSDSVWIIKGLKTGLAFRTEATSIDRVILDPLKLDRPLID